MTRSRSDQHDKISMTDPFDQCNHAATSKCGLKKHKKSKHEDNQSTAHKQQEQPNHQPDQQRSTQQLVQVQSCQVCKK